ncbi:MAG: delta-lactam-biosynthetic de-N-acetylase [Caproiciproducens sp.]|nr:delta-lactam-biosynthetic de-N-acetylase [Caproiciproducens sp.]
MFITIKKKHIEIVLLCLIIVVVGIVAFSHRTQEAVQTSASNTNWGLGFKENGKQPTGNASPAFLKQYNAYFVGAADKKIIYLTFDAGYENGYTPRILDALKKHNVKATFFVVGNYLKTSPDLVKRMLSEGHIVGNHTLTHPDMS